MQDTFPHVSILYADTNMCWDSCREVAAASGAVASPEQLRCLSPCCRATARPCLVESALVCSAEPVAKCFWEKPLYLLGNVSFFPSDEEEIGSIDTKYLTRTTQRWLYSF